MQGDQADNVLLHGASGVGKTVLTRHSLQKLVAEADIQTGFVRCSGKSTAGIVRSVLHALPGQDPPANTPLEDLCTTLYESADNPMIVVLDEADDLPEIDALDRLADVPHLSVVVICHKPDRWLARLDDDVRRDLEPRSLGLDRYGVDELADILEERARLGLDPGTVTRRQLERIADEIAGVARKGIQSLLEAARIADERDHEQIRDADVDDSFERAQFRILVGSLNTLPFHHQVLYEIVRQGRELGPSELHDRYEAVADDVYHGRGRTPICERERRTKLRKLEDYELIAIEGENRHKTYRVCDERVGPPVGVSIPARQ